MKHLPAVFGSMTLIAAAAAVSPAVAQPTASTATVTADNGEDITVVGRYGRAPDSVQSLSQVVSYADLDLSTQAGRDELRHRINLTARYLCDKLGESDTVDPLTGSCRGNATSDAMNRVGTIEQGFAPRGTAWVRPAPWRAPYPADWYHRYP